MRYPPHLKKRDIGIVKRLRSELRAYGISLLIRKSPEVSLKGNKCAGYFSTESSSLVVGGGLSRISFMSTLFHEYGHFLQWRDFFEGRRTPSAREWEDFINAPNLSKRCSRYLGTKWFKATVGLEKGAERTSHTLLKKYNIGSKKDRRWEKEVGMLYLYSHRLMLEKRRWFRPSASPGEWLQTYPELSKHLPRGYRNSFLKIPKRVRAIIEKRF